MAKRVLAWLRVSGLAQSKSDREGIPVQKKQIEKLCRRFDLQVPEDGWYQLGMRVDRRGRIVSEMSGTLVQDSKEFHQIQERLATDRTLAGIVVAKVDRLIRFDKISSIGILVKPFEDLYTEDNENIRIYTTLKSSSRNLNLLDATDQKDFLDACQYAADERFVIRTRTLEAREENRLDEDRVTDKLPSFVGTKPLDTEMGTVTFHYVEPHISNIVAAADELLAGATLGTLAKKYGYSAQSPLRWAMQSEWLIGNKTRLYGFLKDKSKLTNKPEDRGKVTKVRLESLTHEQREKLGLPEPVRLKTNLTPAMTKKKWDAVQALLHEHHTTWLRQGKHDDEYLGHHLLHCSCGLPTYFVGDYHSGRPKVTRYYRCASKSNKIKPGCDAPTLQQELVDAAIVEQASTIFSDSRYVALAIERSMDRKAIAAAEKDVERETRSVESLTGQLARYKKMFAAGIESALEDATETQRKIKAAEKRLVAAQQKAKGAIPADAVQSVAEKFAAAFRDFGTKTIPEQKAILQEHFDGIQISYHLPEHVYEAMADRQLTAAGKGLVHDWVYKRVPVAALNDVKHPFWKDPQVDPKKVWTLVFTPKPQYPNPYGSGIQSERSTGPLEWVATPS